MTTHDPLNLQRFQEGETRLVWAVRADDPDQGVFFPPTTPVDQRPDFRELTRSLRCIVPECRGELEAHFRASKRDGFRHRGSSGGHSPETVFHQSAKARFAQWVTESRPALDVKVEASTDDHSRRPDITLSGDGHTMAVEIQYSALTVADWQARQADLLRNADSVLWLLGHVGPHFRVRKKGGMSHSALAQELIRAGQVPLWFNPVRDLILMTTHGSDWAGIVAPQFRFAQSAVVAPLTDCYLSRDGLVPPWFAEMKKGQADRDEWDEDMADQTRALIEYRREATRKRMEETAARVRQWSRRG